MLICYRELNPDKTNRTPTVLFIPLHHYRGYRNKILGTGTAIPNCVFLFYTPNPFFTHHWCLADVNFTPAYSPREVTKKMLFLLKVPQLTLFGVLKVCSCNSKSSPKSRWSQSICSELFLLCCDFSELQKSILRFSFKIQAVFIFLSTFHSINIELCLLKNAIWDL